MTMKKIIALDIGTVRIGVAISDPESKIAMPLTTVNVSQNTDPIEDIATIISANGVSHIVAGWPLDLDGSEGNAVKRTRAFLQKLKKRLPNLKIAKQDERLTSVAAEQALQDMGTTGSHKKKHVDAIAATMILQMFLDKK